MARRVAGPSQLARSYLMDRLERDLAEAIPISEELVAQASGIPAPAPGRWGIIDRATWADVNIASMSALLNPLVDRVSSRLDYLPMPLRLTQRAVVSTEVGVLLGYVSRRVLGQYDLLVPDEKTAAPRRRTVLPGPALYFVGVNIVEMERRFAFVPRDFALWVALHEVTHRFQFEGVPWLREHFLSLVTSYVGSVDLDASTFAGRLAGAARRLVASGTPPEERHPVYLLSNEEQRTVLNEIQALMAVVEGHGNFVMDYVGADVIPSMHRMRGVFEKRRQQANYVQRAVSYALGLDMKLRQYELGHRFCQEAVAVAGVDVLSRLWTGPEYLPTLPELKEPHRWLGRVAA